MRAWQGACVGAGLMLLAPLAAAQSEPVTSVDSPRLQTLAEAAGAVVESQMLSDLGPVVYARTPTGLRFVLMGKVCEGEGGEVCRGLQIMSVFRSEIDVDLAHVNAVNYAMAGVSVWKVPDEAARDAGAIGVNRYLILDEGQSFDNLVLNIRVFTTQAERARDKLLQAAGAAPADPGETRISER